MDVDTIVGVFDAAVLELMETITVALPGFCRVIPRGSPMSTVPPIGRWLLSL